MTPSIASSLPPIAGQPPLAPAASAGRAGFAAMFEPIGDEPGKILPGLPDGGLPVANDNPPADPLAVLADFADAAPMRERGAARGQVEVERPRREKAHVGMPGLMPPLLPEKLRIVSSKDEAERSSEDAHDQTPPREEPAPALAQPDPLLLPLVSGGQSVPLAPACSASLAHGGIEPVDGASAGLAPPLLAAGPTALTAPEMTQAAEERSRAAPPGRSDSLERLGHTPAATDLSAARPAPAPLLAPVPPTTGAREAPAPGPISHPADAGQIPAAVAAPPQAETKPPEERPAASATPRPSPVPLTPAPLDTAARLVGRTASGPAPRAATPRATAVIEPPAPTLTTAAALAATAAAAAPSQPEPIDMARHGWPTTMIAHIERLRDEADAVSTAIRLIPDALGTIDVSLKQDGEVTHVHLAAEQPQTRALLVEAAPKLAELAEQRGLKLGDAQVQAGPGNGQQSGSQQAGQQPAPRRPAAPPPARRDPEPHPDDRIA